jgi:membrane glycosyltransferase
VGWTTQQRDAEGVPFWIAARCLLPQTLLGVIFAVWLWRVAPGAIWYGAPFILGLVGSIPLAMLTAHPRLGRALGTAGLCRVPEEARLPEESERAGLFTPFALAPTAAAAAE